MHNVSNKMVKGAAWMVAFKFVERSIGLLSTFILARLLAPDDFGLVAIATSFLGLLLLLTSFSFDVALIQNQNADKVLYNTAWTFNVIAGVFLAFLLMIFAIPISNFYNEIRLEKILYVLAFSTFIDGFSNIGPVAFRKNLEFHKEFYFLLSKKIISFSVCILLAFSLRSYWALVWGSFAGKVLEVFLSYKVHPYRPRLSLAGTRNLFGFSMWMFFNNSLFFAYNRLADFVISKLFGGHVLGIYSIAYELSNLPTTELVAPINRAVLPGYSKLADDELALRQGFLNVLSVIALFAVPSGVGLALVAEPLVLVVLGDKWKEVIPLMEILSLSGMLIALQTNASVVYNALAKPKYMTFILFIHIVVIFIPLLLIFIKDEGAVGVSKAYLISNLLIWPLNYFIVMKLIGVKFSSIVLVIWRPFLSATLMFFLTRSIQISVKGGVTPMQDLLMCVGSGVFLYLFFDVLFWILTKKPNGAETFILSKLRDSMR